jgi:D-sedoheptulose 7-phosphate isomerase
MVANTKPNNSDAWAILELSALYLKQILEEQVRTIKSIATLIEKETHYNKATIYLVGNGGSSATMSHLTSDLINLGIPVICLTDNVPALTAKTNDSGWDKVYSELVEGRLRAGDILMMASVNGGKGLSPDGEHWSNNLMELCYTFRRNYSTILGLFGNDGGYLKDECYRYLSIPSTNPYVVEGVHSVWAHAIVAEIKTIKEECDD